MLKTICVVLCEVLVTCLTLILIAIGLGWIYTPDSVRYVSAHRGFLVAVANFPILFLIYGIGFNRGKTGAVTAMFVSFVWKGVVISVGIYSALTIPGYSYEPLTLSLFFTIFLLGFFAIYFGHRASSLTLQMGDSNGSD